MKAVVQRTKRVTLSVDGKKISEIEKGFAVYFGVKRGDEKEKADYLAKKIAALRVFEDENGKMNLSLKDVDGEILLISQFTLYADVSHGNRPGFSDAEEPTRAKEIYEYFGDKLVENGARVKYGVFGADMKIEQFNDGPVTIIYEI
ncbi:MAG: D-tyrosyl-tRNA(Tyr) deacylase [Clostridia bacterium]|nr:D-tyrosyl-tRNA(Tyr) deacylase [Clostridia bacterium]